MSVTVDI